MHYVSFHSSIVPNYDFVNINEMWMDSEIVTLQEIIHQVSWLNSLNEIRDCHDID